MKRTRPTLRCLCEDLNIPLGPVDHPLDEINHPLLTKANEQFGEHDTPHERIVAIDDQVLFKVKVKVKVRRWRGAAWIDQPAADAQVWLVAAGLREDGSTADFSATLTADAKAARSCHNATHSPPVTTTTYTAHVLPTEADRARYQAEAAARFERQLFAEVHNLVRASLLDGKEHSVTVLGAILDIQVQADQGHETYVAVRIIGSVPDTLTATVLALVPGCDVDGWFPEYALPERSLRAAEQAWSNIMNPIEAAKLLDDGH